MEPPGMKQREMRFMDVVKEDMELVCVRTEKTEDRTKWRQMIHCGNP